MRVGFLGTPEVSCIPLRQLVEAGHEVPIVITQPDRRRSRRGDPEPTPVKRLALELGIEVSHELDDLSKFDCDLAVVAAFGRLIPASHLDRLTFVNIHPSLLPRWRGAAPVQHTILAGDVETGVCVMKLVQRMDEGPLYAVESTRVGARETADELLERLFLDGSRLLVDCLGASLPAPVEQAGTPTYAGKLSAEDLRIDWTDPADKIDRVVRAGRAWTTLRDRRLIVERAEPVLGPPRSPGSIEKDLVGTGAGLLRLVSVRQEGKPVRSGLEWSNGARIGTSERLV